MCNVIDGVSMFEQLYTATQCRELDRIAIEDFGMLGFDLMRRAGRVAFAELLDSWPEARRLSICCGKGNNAGDGYIIAGLARSMGLTVDLLQLGEPGDLQGDAGRARDWAVSEGVRPTVVESQDIQLNGDVIVDGLLGTGLSRPLRGSYAAMVRAINASGAPVLAIDVPSGVNADTGACADPTVAADVTVTFIGRKRGLHSGPGISAAGRLVYADLEVGRAVLDRVPGIPLLDIHALLAARPLPQRDRNAYKQALGHVVVVGGEHSMGGAVLLAAEATLRVGAGMVSVVTRATHRNAILARRPELMVVDADDTAARHEIFDRASTFIVGPGLGRQQWGFELLQEVLALAKPTVVDADGLNALAHLDLQLQGPVIVTPHSGEAATLLNKDSASVQQDRFAAARALATRVSGVAVLKGAGTVIASHDADDSALLGVCAHGNPGMATAGMGDVLAGVVGGLLAQGCSTADAAVYGVCLHSCAGDLAGKQVGERSLLATDLLPHLMTLLKDT